MEKRSEEGQDVVVGGGDGLSWVFPPEINMKVTQPSDKMKTPWIICLRDVYAHKWWCESDRKIHLDYFFKRNLASIINGASQHQVTVMVNVQWNVPPTDIHIWCATKWVLWGWFMLRAGLHTWGYSQNNWVKHWEVTLCLRLAEQSELIGFSRIIFFSGGGQRATFVPTAPIKCCFKTQSPKHCTWTGYLCI